jgi:plastocyanin
MTIKSRSWLVLLTIAWVLSACGGGDGGSAEAPVKTNRVDLPKSYRFDPPVIQVATGTTVTWINNDDFPHNVHLLAGDEVTKPLPVGGRATLTFQNAGEFRYECSLHPQQMQGRVVVETASSG